jgi:hypothetical protein
MRRLHSQHGFALVTIMGVMLLLVVYLATVQGSIGMTHRLSKRGATRLDLAEATASVIDLVLAQNAATTQTLTLKMQAPNGLKARVSRVALPAGDPLWQKLPALRPQAGDALLTVAWEGTALPPSPNRFILNTQRLRRGVISLGASEKTK